MEHIKPQSGGHVARADQAQHEESDVNIKAIVGFGIFLVISAVVIHVALYGLYLFFDNMAEKQNAPPNPMMRSEKPVGTPTMSAESQAETAKRLNRTFGGNALNPMLQVDDVHDMDMMRKAQDTQMSEYQWTNKGTGNVRIPIDRAMDLIAERGLPNVPMLPPGKAAAAAGAAAGANAPTPNATTNPPASQRVLPASQRVKQ
jgi:hypothetical protein